MFTKIRSKSVGETADILVPCSECETKNEVKVDLDDVVVDSEIPEMLVQITDDVSVQMKFPTYDDFLGNTNLLDSTTVTEGLLQLIITCMDSVLTEEERFSLRDETAEDVINFLESMTSEQFERISQFANNIPNVTKTISFSCESCGPTKTKKH